MAWTLVDTETTTGTEYAGTAGTVNPDFDTFYFRTSTKVFSWDGATLTDISGGYFTGGSSPHGIFDICWFKGTLYAIHYNEGAGAGSYVVVSRWDGGTSWTRVRILVNNVGTQALADTGYHPSLSTDGTTLVATAKAGGGASSINSSADGTTWGVDTWELAYNTSPELILPSIDHLQGWLGRYSKMVAFQDSGDDLAVRSAGDWAEQSPGLAAGGVLIGHTDDYLFYHDGGSPYTIYRTDKNDWGASPTALATTHSARPILVYNVGSDAIMMHLLNQNDAYIWNGSDFVADGSLGAVGGYIRSYFRLGTTLYLMASAAGTVYFYSGGSVTPFDGGDIGRRHLGLATDQVNLYVTGAEDGTLFLEVYELATLSLARRVTFGGASFAEIDSRSRGLMPVARPGTDEIVYLRGRDGSDAQVQVSDDGGYVFLDLDDGGWASDKFCVALLIDPLQPTDLVAVFSDDDIYRSRTGGTTWSKVDDGPVTLREAARHPVAELDLILAGQGSGAGELFFSPNLGVTSEDVSEATMGRVNGVEVSR
jgi:hypothetical protein